MKSWIRIAPATILLFLAACNLPAAGQATPAPSLNEQAATLVAATLQAAASPVSPAVTPFNSPAAPAASPTIKPTLLVNADNASCRGGPGADFKVIATFAAGTVVDLAGKDTADSYYIVIDPASHDLCWIQAQNGTPSGSFSLLPELTPPAGGTPAANVPARPTALFYNFECLGGGQVKVDLRWTDAANNEKGYRVYRDGNQIADLPAGSTSYSDTTSISSGTVLVYQVAAYNDAGVSAQAVTGNGDPIACQ